MKLNILILIFLSFNSLGPLWANTKWVKIVEIKNKHVFYINVNSINEEKGYIYFWELIDYSSLDEYGDHSARIFIKGDCINSRFKWKKIAYHKMPMARDEKEPKVPEKHMRNWHYPRDNSTSKLVLDYACNAVGISV